MTPQNPGLLYDVVVVGGGPAGLSAALVLARARRRVIVLDSGEYRNAPAKNMHNYLGLDGLPPEQLRQQGRAELARYGVQVLSKVQVTDVKSADGFFYLTYATQDPLQLPASRGMIKARKVILATGVKDDLPPIPGVKELFGRSIFHCPYCDGWEVRDQPLAVVGADAVDFARKLQQWSRDVFWFSEGAVADRAPLYFPQKVVQFTGDDHQVFVHQAGGRVTVRRAVFLKLRQRQRSALPEILGLKVEQYGVVHWPNGQTAMRGVFVAGDMTKDLGFSIMAAAEGAHAAVACDDELREDGV